MSTTRWLRNSAVATWSCCALLWGCSAPDPGPQVTQPRDVSGFDRVDVRGAASIDVSVGPAHSLTIEGAQNDLDGVVSRVENGALIIEDRDGWMWNSRRGSLRLRITTPALQGLSVSGAGDVTLHGVNGGDLSLSVQGAGELKGSGTVQNLNAQLSGAGNMELEELSATNANVVVNGAGNMELNVTGTLVATVNGLGNIHYRGNPAQVQTAMNGVGSISPR